MDYRWSDEKSDELKRTRGLSFEEIRHAEVIGVVDNPSRPDQYLILFLLNDYVWVVPCVISEEEIFLKTLFPSRKYTRLWRSGELA